MQSNLIKLAKATKVQEKIVSCPALLVSILPRYTADSQRAMASGEHINITEDRAVMHMALRASEADEYVVDGSNVVPDVHAVLKRIAAFADSVRSGQWVGATGKKLTHVVSVGIGGSYLGPEFVYEALRSGM